MFSRILFKLRGLIVRLKDGKVHFDASPNPNKIDELVPKPRAIMRVDGAFNNLEGPKGGTGMFVKSLRSSYQDFKSVYYPDARETFEKHDCSSVMEYVAIRDGVEYAQHLLHARKILCPVAVFSDHQAAVSNTEKLYRKMPHHIGCDTIERTREIVELIKVMPGHSSFLWDSGPEGRSAHYLATACIKEGKPKKQAIEKFYLNFFSFKPYLIHKLLEWTLNICHARGIKGGCSVLEVGTGNGVVLHHLNKLRFSEDLTGVDSSEGVIQLARECAEKNGDYNLTFLVDDIMHTQLDRQFHLVVDHGTFEAMSLHPHERLMYWDSLATLVSRGGILVISSSEVLEMVGPGFEIVDASHLGEEDRVANVIACQKL